MAKPVRYNLFVLDKDDEALQAVLKNNEEPITIIDQKVIETRWATKIEYIVEFDSNASVRRFKKNPRIHTQKRWTGPGATETNLLVYGNDYGVLFFTIRRDDYATTD